MVELGLIETFGRTAVARPAVLGFGAMMVREGWRLRPSAGYEGWLLCVRDGDSCYVGGRTCLLGHHSRHHEGFVYNLGLRGG